MATYNWPLVENNITQEDRVACSEFISSGERLTHGAKVEEFEETFANWLDARYGVMVNSGSSANLLTMAAFRKAYGQRPIIVPSLTWVSDIAAVLHAGLEPYFVDVDPYTLGINWKDAPHLPSFVTHCLGFNSLPESRGNVIIEDCCEALGATDENGDKLGSRSLMSNFSFYYSHHLTTIEGGMICTNDRYLYEVLRRMRSHGLLREMKGNKEKLKIAEGFPDLDPQFTFLEPAWNVRPTEINAVLGLSQLKRLNWNNRKRTEHLKLFLSNLDPDRFVTKYRVEGSCSFALPLVLKQPDESLMRAVLQLLRSHGVEYRKGTVGGGNQLRQPYAKALWGEHFHKRFPQAEYLSDFGLFIGNYPTLKHEKIIEICDRLNDLKDVNTTFHVPV